jgi:hypothetical protein
MRLATLAVLALTTASTAAGAEGVEKWSTFEAAFRGPAEGNPFASVSLTARFVHENEFADVTGFYDGEGTYRVRFMPPAAGDWRFTTRSNRPELDGKTGVFTALPPAKGNHGPVVVRNRFHFAYADGTPYVPVGTTCYAWTHQTEAVEGHTLATLKTSPFNKIRMCVFPKFYAYNQGEPPRYPFEGSPPKDWDLSRYNPEFFRHLEQRVAQLRDMGVEADLILFHPYDKGHWGFDRMPPGADDAYLRYLIARLSAYRNVWWSLANEFDFMAEKKDADWDRLIRVVAESDPYGHLRSIHNGTRLYNHTNPLLTHASIQNGSAVADFGRAVLYRDVYDKPVVFDEAKYEGDLPQRWGNISAEEMVHRFWQGAVAGTYTGHGETYLDPNDLIWWSRGGALRGSSPPRISFLRRLLEEGPAGGIDPVDKWQVDNVAGRKGEYYLVYLGKSAPSDWAAVLPRTGLNTSLTLRVDVIDTWGMTVTPIEGTFTFTPRDNYTLTCSDRPTIPLPGKPYMALRFRKAE